MKQHISHLLLAAAAATALSACNDYLDELPDNRMELKNPSEVSRLLVSAYPQIHPAYLLEMYSDNTDDVVGTGWTEYTKFQGQAYRWEDITETSDNETPQRIWQAGYSAVGTANEALKYINSLDEETQEEYDEQKGEALLCRAYAMFQMANVFCMAYDESTASSDLGLPYPEYPEENVGEQYDRGTLADLYAHIDADITEAVGLVGSSYDHPKFHFTPSSAAAFAARFYLYYGKNDKAVTYATKVLGSQPEAMLRDWAAMNELSANGNVQPNAFINSGVKANLLLTTVYSQWGAIGGPYNVGSKYAHGQLISKLETLQSPGPWGTSDEVFNYTVWFNSALSKYIFRKIPHAFEYTDIQAGIGYAHSEYAVFTTDLLLLERAEAYALQGKYDEAVADINAELSAFSSTGVQLTLDKIVQFYSQSVPYYTATSGSPKKRFNAPFAIEPETQEPLLQCILHLRRILGLHEGFRLQDVKRYGITMYRRTLANETSVSEVTDTMEPRDPRLAIQLPQDVLAAGMTPNPR